jgi:hypothetical protein
MNDKVDNTENILYQLNLVAAFSYVSSHRVQEKKKTLNLKLCKKLIVQHSSRPFVYINFLPLRVLKIII